MPYKEQAESMLANRHEDHDIVAPDGRVYRWNNGMVRCERDGHWYNINDGWGLGVCSMDGESEHEIEASRIGSIIVLLSAIESGVDLWGELDCGMLYCSDGWINLDEDYCS